MYSLVAIVAGALIGAMAGFVAGFFLGFVLSAILAGTYPGAGFEGFGAMAITFWTTIFSTLIGAAYGIVLGFRFAQRRA